MDCFVSASKAAEKVEKEALIADARANQQVLLCIFYVAFVSDGVTRMRALRRAACGLWVCWWVGCLCTCASVFGVYCKVRPCTRA